MNRYPGKQKPIGKIARLEWGRRRALADSHPVPQPVSTRIVEWNTRFVHLATRCLTDHENLGLSVELDDRPRTKR